jgi:hypothetical protein
METCKATIQEGTRKGERCVFPSCELNPYCGRHQRNYEYDSLIESGKKPCRFFFRGCNIILEETESSLSCKTCREKVSKKTTSCSHDGCKFKTDDSKYCKKHERDKYRDEELEKHIKYCDISRGCFIVLKENEKSCQSCLEKVNKSDKKRYQKRCEMHNALENIKNTTYQVCVKCGDDFEKYLTHANTSSKLCQDCNHNQKAQDKKRESRVRKFKDERYNNIEGYYKSYIKNANKRGYTMELQFDEFKTLINMPCYYCNSSIENEVNGIDRVDNTKGYTKENSVACCGICNRIKLNYHPLFFIEKCKIISKQDTNIIGFVSKWKEYYTRCKEQSYIAYKNKAEIERNLSFHLTEEDWNTLMNQPCYLCGYKNKNMVGIDRVDNTIREYTNENVKTCCGSCNLMKGEVSLSILLEKANLIANHCQDVSVFNKVIYNKDEIKKNMKKIRNILSNTSERTSWKALGVYYSIIGESNEFYESYKDIYSQEKFNKLKEIVKSSSKDESVIEIKRTLVALKKQRQRNS